jgi:hypothetical protein
MCTDLPRDRAMRQTTAGLIIVDLRELSSYRCSAHVIEIVKGALRSSGRTTHTYPRASPLSLKST